MYIYIYMPILIYKYISTYIYIYIHISRFCSKKCSSLAAVILTDSNRLSKTNKFLDVVFTGQYVALEEQQVEKIEHTANGGRGTVDTDWAQVSRPPVPPGFFQSSRQRYSPANPLPPPC